MPSKLVSNSCDNQPNIVRSLNAYAIGLFITLVLGCNAALAKDLVLVTPSSSAIDVRGNYASALLIEALNHSSPNKYNVVFSEPMNEARAERQMHHGIHAHVMWAAARTEWDKTLIAVKRPLLRGLLGQRVLLINQYKQPIFEQITDIEQLKKLKLGTGHVWSITRIFQQNNFNLVTSSNYDGLFKMLAKDRFDFFPRGVNEVLAEVQSRSHNYPNMVIEKTILLQTKLPVYYYVTPAEPDMAKDIEVGLDAIQKNGNFDLLFTKYFGQLQQELQLTKRKVFILESTH
ncbi:transporter substrate-binding domain-containing protein [Catenovulum agarivorans]|uniref:transporter substrate-binding domain-containing protein n=1 Tax=Catenovulum agarivorans TaxID=1172192 RepID=UPI00037ADCAB|nr:transporter substrate-binding domain-containing protein [Catenovulum agarivorans]